jgi:hypothetical protein
MTVGSSSSSSLLISATGPTAAAACIHMYRCHSSNSSGSHKQKRALYSCLLATAFTLKYSTIALERGGVRQGGCLQPLHSRCTNSCNAVFNGL